MIVTANLQSIAGTDDVGLCMFKLVGYGTSMPFVVGSPPTILSNTSCMAWANDDGQISQEIVGNDLISPPNTTYVIQMFSGSGNFICEGRYSITGTGTVDLSALTQL
jgi:hypothetical protein